MVSVYVYGGQVEREEEIRLIFKEFKLGASVIHKKPKYLKQHDIVMGIDEESA